MNPSPAAVAGCQSPWPLTFAETATRSGVTARPVVASIARTVTVGGRAIVTVHSAASGGIVTLWRVPFVPVPATSSSADSSGSHSRSSPSLPTFSKCQTGTRSLSVPAKRTQPAEGAPLGVRKWTATSWPGGSVRVTSSVRSSAAIRRNSGARRGARTSTTKLSARTRPASKCPAASATNRPSFSAAVASNSTVAPFTNEPFWFTIFPRNGRPRSSVSVAVASRRAASSSVTSPDEST